MEQKNIKWIIIGILSYFLYIILNILITVWLEWWGIGWMLAFIFIPLLLGGIIFGVIFAYRMAKKSDKDKEIFNKKQELNATTVKCWIVKKIMEEWGDNLKIEQLILKQSGKEGKRTPIIYITGKGEISSLPYHITINLLEPEAKHTIRTGICSEALIDKDVENLSFAPDRKLKEIFRQETPMFSTEIEREKEEPEYLELEEEKKK